jgi:hypothetical protein
MPNPVVVEEEGRKVTTDDLTKYIHFCSGWKDVEKIIENYRKVGVNEVNIFTGCDKERIQAYAENILNIF